MINPWIIDKIRKKDKELKEDKRPRLHKEVWEDVLKWDEYEKEKKKSTVIKINL